MRAQAPAPLYWLIEDADPLACDLHLLQELLASADDPYTQGLLAGIYTARVHREHEGPLASVAPA